MNKKILVLDDNQPTLYVILEALNYAGYDVRIFSSSVDLFHHLEEFKPDLLLLDYFLEGINGGEICHQVKTNPETANLPVIIISGHTNVLLSLGTYGCDAVLSKPFGLEDLLELVRSNLSLKSEESYD